MNRFSKFALPFACSFLVAGCSELWPSVESEDPAAPQQVEIPASQAERVDGPANTDGSTDASPLRNSPETPEARQGTAARTAGQPGSGETSATFAGNEVDAISGELSRLNERIDELNARIAELNARAAAVQSNPAPTSSDRPLVVIHFDRPNVPYQHALYTAVSRALDRKPDATFQIVAVSPQAGSPAHTARNQTAAKRNAEDVQRALADMGLPAHKVSLSSSTSTDAEHNEVRIFVR